MEKVLGYVRVSTTQQSEKGSSLEVQRLKIEEYCKFKEYDLIEVYEDKGISGMSIDKREGYKELLSYLKDNEVDVLVVHSLSRLGRKMRDVIECMELLKREGISFYSIKENLSNSDRVGSLIVNILSSINEFEVEQIRDRIKEVKRSKKERGLVYGRLQYGFNKTEDGRLVRNEEEMKVVKRIKNLRSRGHSWESISKRLNEDSVPTKHNGRWYGGTVYNMMKTQI